MWLTWFTGLTFPLLATAVQSKGHTLKCVNNPSFGDVGLTAKRRCNKNQYTILSDKTTSSAVYQNT